MKNIVFLIIDSMNYSHMLENPSLTPFINSLKEDGIFFDNMFSQAPYTEAATMNIYCGQNVLDNGGYLKRFNNAKMTIFEAMKQKGYETYYNSFQPQCYASSLREGVDNIYYNVGFDISALWSYRIYFYSKLYESKQLNDTDYSLLENILNDNFVEWIRFVNDYLKETSSINMISSNSINYEATRVLDLVNAEYTSFQKNKRGYIDNLLEQGKKHSLFNIPAFDQNNKIKNKDFIKQVQVEAKSLFDLIYKKNKKLNKKNCKGKFNGAFKKLKDFLKRPNLSNLKNFGKSMLLVKNIFNDADLYDRIADNYETFKNAPSIKTHLDHYISWETSRNKGKPSFACIHVDDIHNPEVFFTYDTEDIELIKKELGDAEDIVNSLPNNYYGNITHDLSLKYIDGKIKYFYDELRRNDLLDDTVVLICADHGFSFSGNPLRDSFVINMYLENYRIPCIITGSEKIGKIDKLCTSKDIPSILCYLADGSIPKEFDGKNVIVEPEYDVVFIEYCGGGCPDINRRDLKIACFDKQYFVASLNKLDEKLEYDSATEIYDLSNDPKQLKNLINKRYDVEKVNHLIDLINERKKEIKNTNINCIR